MKRKSLHSILPVGLLILFVFPVLTSGAELKVVEEIHINSGIHTLTINPSNRNLWVTHYGGGDLSSQGGFSVIDTNDNSLNTITDITAGTTNGEVAFAGGFVYLTDYYAGQVKVIRLSDLSVVDSIDGFLRPVSAFAHPSGAYVYVSQYAGGRVSVIRVSDNIVVDTISVGGQPVNFAFAADERHLVVTNYQAGSLAVIDTANPESNVLAGTVPLGSPYPIVADPVEGVFYVGDILGRRVVILSQDWEVVGVVHLSHAPWFMDIDPAGEFVCISGSGPEISVIRTANKFVNTISLGYQIADVAVHPEGNTVYAVDKSADTGGVVYALDIELPVMVEKIVWQTERAGNKDVWIMNPDGSEKMPLTTHAGIDSYAIISPDGNTIAFHSDRTGDYQLWLMDVDGGNKRQLTTAGGWHPTWSPDGSKIYFNMGNGWEISVINADGTGREYVGQLGANMSINSEGTKLVFYPPPGPNPNNYDIVVSDVDGSNRVNLSHLAGLTGFERPNGRNVWGSNGLIMFTGQEPSYQGTNGYDIWWLREDGSSGVILAEPNISESMMSWSPDERQIVFTSNRSNGYNVWIMDSDGNNLQQLTDHPARDFIPYWGYVNITQVETCEGYPTSEKDVIYLGQHPSDIAVTPDETFLYTAGSTGDTSIEAVRLSDNTVTPIPVGNTPWGVAVSPDGCNVYASNFYDGTVSIIQTSDNTVIDTVNVGDGPIWLESTNANVYVANHEAGTVSVIRRWDNHVFDPVQVGVNPQAIAPTPDGRFVYVANRGGESVSVIQARDRTVIATIDVPGEPAHLAVSADGSTVYVSQHLLNQVSKIDTATNTIVGDPIHVGYRPVILATSPNGEYLFVLRHYADEIDVVDTATDSIVDVISVGDGPYDVAFSADGCRVYVPNHHNRTISVLEGFNHPPVADAGGDLTIFAREVPDTTVNGNGWDEDADSLDCRWLQDGNVLVDWAPVGVNGECLLDLEVFLPDVGEHVLTLDVSDGLAVSTDSMLLLVAPNTAAGFGRDVEVNWDKQFVEIKGNFVLPDGMYMEDFTPDGIAAVTLADVKLPSQAVGFSVDKKGKWKYSDEDNSFGSIIKFEVDWKGQQFKFKGPEKIELKTEFIGADTTVLKVKPGKIKGDFTISIDGTTLAFVYDADTKSFYITPACATILEQKRKEAKFTLPYPLTPDMTIEVSGTVNLTIPVADHFKEGSSKFKLKMAFNPADFNGTATLPDVLEFLITLGSGNQLQFDDLIGVDPKVWTKKDEKKWEYKR